MGKNDSFQALGLFGGSKKGRKLGDVFVTVDRAGKPIVRRPRVAVHGPPVPPSKKKRNNGKKK